VEINLRFKFRNDTKGCYRYEEVHKDTEPPIIGALYIRKYAVEGEKPKEIIVSVRNVDEGDA